MKKFSRLTALLLALTVLMTSMPLMSLASSITVDIDTWNSWVEEAQNAAANQTETVTTTVPVTGETSVVDRPVVEAALTAHEGVETSATQAVTLPIAGKLVLKAFDGASSYQWQVKAGSQWANIVGDRSASTTLTYAKIQNAISGGVAQVRCVMVVDGQDYVSATAQVTVDDTVTYTTVETESTLTVTAEVPVQRNYGLRSNGAATYENTETPNTYSVVINYRFENDEIAADPYTASLAAGTSFSATVNFPTVQGYLPYLNETQQNSLELNITEIDQDHIYNVVYKPTNVDYTVIHYQQNLNDDNYTEAERETKQGLTNSTVPDVAKAYEGFYALLYEKPAIAADGSTVVEVYYDRYYYLMNFDLDGGYGVEPIYARYGAPISDVGTPTKAGYTFVGWSLDGSAPSKTLPPTMPAKNSTYKAVWQADATAKVTVVFWGENADDKEYSYIKSAQVNVKPGTDFTYSENGSLICALEEHTHSIDKCYDLTCTQEVHTHSESCYTCGQSNHSHDVSCYEGAVNTESAPGIIGNNVPSNPDNGYVTREAISLSGKVIYINGTWYKYNGSIRTGNIAPTTCGKTEGTHIHTDECLGCNQTVHTHSVENNCYTLTCTKPVHSHNSDCYMSGAGLDSNLWKFMRSDTVTVAADGSSVVNVYYDRVEYDVRFYSRDDGNPEYTNLRITAKWGASILDKWPTLNGSSSWYVDTSGNTWQNSIQIMPVGGAKFYGPKTGSSNYKAYYYVEVLPGEQGVEHNGVTDKLHPTDVSSSSGNVTDEERYEIRGFTYKEGTSNGSSYNNAKFYYTRNAYDIEFFNPTSLIKKVEDVPYESPLDSYDFIPGDEWIPEKYEPGSVVFEGWYLNPECSGEKYILSEHTMPVGPVKNETSLSLYAKWVPVIRTVEFYKDADALENGKKCYEDKKVTHGTVIGTVAPPENGSYTFVGWFYMENGVEKAFDFANMPVNKDLQVYGKWSSNVLKQYTVYYKYKDAAGNEIEIADPTTGSGLAGITKTFEAKGGTDLYTDYQEGYFPVTKSHSMTLDIEDESKNTFTFWYVQMEAVPYTVKYLNKVTGTPVATEKTVSDNRKAVVTETFVPVSGMMPDAYQKRLVVSAEEGAVNEIIFYYTEDTTHAYYKITHYTENLAKDAQGNTTWTEYASSQAVGDIGETYTADPMTIPGFTYDSTVDGTVASGELTANGLELKLYYKRNSYPYQVRYLEQGTGNQLANPKNGTGKYGEIVSESAIDIANYTAVAPTSQTLNIRIEDGTEAKLNIITFYYTENEATINYKVVGPEGCGTVSPTSETLKVLSGTAQGSTATATSNVYKFVGWYANEACSGEPISTNAKYVPIKADGAAWLDGTTYYAKFEYNLTTLTIRKEGLDVKTYTDGSDREMAIFDVTVVGENNQNVTYTIALANKGEATIDNVLIGSTYTITEKNDWTWRYANNSVVTGTVQLNKDGSGPRIVISNEHAQDHWLGGDNYKVNEFSSN